MFNYCEKACKMHFILAHKITNMIKSENKFGDAKHSDTPYSSVRNELNSNITNLNIDTKIKFSNP